MRNEGKPAGEAPDAGFVERTYRIHRQGAYVRTASSLVMWVSCLIAYWAGLIHREHLLSDTLAVAYLVLMNPPLLWGLRRVRTARGARCFARFINFLEIVGYTAVIHSFGGIEATFLMLIYAALITYVGVVDTREAPYVVAAMCGLCFLALVALEHAGALAPLRINPTYRPTWPQQLAIVLVNWLLFFILAFISSSTARIIKSQRDRLESQNRQLQELLGKAQESDRLKTEFLANVSHELRTPLSAVIGFAELLKDGAFGPLDERQRAPLEDIFRSGSHLLAIIDDLLDLSKIAAGRVDVVLAEVPLRRLLEEGIGLFRREAAQKGIRLLPQLDECPLTVRSDERKLRQILYNLLSNAVKFTPENGEVTILARCLRRGPGGWVTGRAEAIPPPPAGLPLTAKEESWLEISVADTGIGLKKEDLERIFNPFEQADGSYRRSYQGTGLGLTIIRRFAELLGGAAWAHSEGEGKGSTFFVLLPMPAPISCAATRPNLPPQGVPLSNHLHL